MKAKVKKGGGRDFVRELTIRYKRRRILKKEKFCMGEVATSSRAVFELFKDLWNSPVEKFFAVYLNSQNIVEGVHIVSTGGPRQSLVSTQVVLAGALLSNACSMVIVHNHPSGCPDPSFDDKVVTRKLWEAAYLFEIKLLDHIIVGEDRYYSFADDGEILKLGALYK